MYAPESKDMVANLLVSIGTVARGSAGGSLHQANAAVCLMKLATIDSGKAEDAVKTYLNGMNATQKDFSSFQWQQALRHTNALLDGSEDPAILDGAGVTDEWKNHTDLEPFNAA